VCVGGVILEQEWVRVLVPPDAPSTALSFCSNDIEAQHKEGGGENRDGRESKRVRCTGRFSMKKGDRVPQTWRGRQRRASRGGRSSLSKARKRVLRPGYIDPRKIATGGAICRSTPSDADWQMAQRTIDPVGHTASLPLQRTTVRTEGITHGIPAGRGRLSPVWRERIRPPKGGGDCAEQGRSRAKQGIDLGCKEGWPICGAVG